MKVIQCPICNDNCNSFINVKSFTIYKCNNCTFQFVWPLPTEEELSYIYNEKTLSGENSTINYETYLRSKNQLTKEYAQVLKILNEFPSKGKLLDVGCAAGFFLNYAKQNNWDVEGVEVSKDLSKFARQELGLNVHTGTLSNVALQPKSYDVVTLIGVIEHLDNPQSVIDNVNRVIKLNGVLIILTENVESFLSKVLKSKWNGYMPPEHLSYFSKKSIQYLIQSRGFRLVNYIEIRSDLRASLGGLLSNSTMKIKMKQSIDSGSEKPSILKATFKKTVNILENFYEYIGFHDRMICVFKKDS